MDLRNVALTTLVAAAFGMSGCGDNTSTGTLGAGGGGANDAGNGGTSGAGTANGGVAGLALCPAGLAQFGPNDIDLTLGGLNADLPAPSQDCLAATPESTMCAALSVMVNGSARELVCTTPVSAAIDGSSLYCRNAAGEDFSIATSYFGGATPPAKFSLSQAELTDSISMQINEGTFGGLNGTPTSAAQAAGWVNRIYDKYYGCDNTMFGVVALTWPDTGSGETRVRGSFHARAFNPG